MFLDFGVVQFILEIVILHLTIAVAEYVIPVSSIHGVRYVQYGAVPVGVKPAIRDT